MNREAALRRSTRIDRSRRIVYADPILAELRPERCTGVCVYEKVNGDYMLIESLCEGENCADCPPRPITVRGAVVEDGDYYILDCMTKPVAATPDAVFELLIRTAGKARLWRAAAIGAGVAAVVLAAVLAWALLGR